MEILSRSWASQSDGKICGNDVARTSPVWLGCRCVAVFVYRRALLVPPVTNRIGRGKPSSPPKIPGSTQVLRTADAKKSLPAPRSWKLGRLLHVEGVRRPHGTKRPKNGGQGHRRTHDQKHCVEEHGSPPSLSVPMSLEIFLRLDIQAEATVVPKGRSCAPSDNPSRNQITGYANRAVLRRCLAQSDSGTLNDIITMSLKSH